jgi:hypothetical protein
MRYVLFWLCAACAGTLVPEQTEVPPAPTQVAAPREIVPASAQDVASRVDDAQKRLAASEGGRIVWRAIEAHGGLEHWLAQGTLAFDFDYRPIGKPEARASTRNEVEVWSAHVRQTEIDGDATLGWDGETAWITPNAEAFAKSARFWALTPYYFVGVPWVFADPGTQFEVLSDTTLDGEAYKRVRITYDPGTGDSPDDYYVLHVRISDGQVGALGYIVAWPGFFEAGKHSPEKFMRYEAYAETGGLQIVSRIRTHRWDRESETVGAVTTEVEIANHASGVRLAAEVFDAPEGAVLSADVESP